MRNDGCSWTGRVSAFFDGEGAAWERWLCRAHARRCATCQSWLEDVRRGWATLRAELDAPPDSRFVNAVMERLDPVPAPAPATPTRSRPSWPLQLVAAGAVVGVLALVLVPIIDHHRDTLLAQNCQSNERQLSRALAAYADDYDDRLPPAGTWASATARYLSSDRLLHCPVDATMPELPSYAFSESLSTRRISPMASPAAVPAVFESDAGRFTPRHDHRGHIAFLDGRVMAVANLTSR